MNRAFAPDVLADGCALSIRDAFADYHARFAQITRRAYIAPARHWASTNTSVYRPPMGMRVRLKASVDISGYSPAMQVILRAMKKYGLILADNGSNWFISGAPDPRWNDNELNTLKGIKGSNFEVVRMENIVTP